MAWMRSIALSVIVMMSLPAPAAAQWVEFMEWLDKLSGPGPFTTSDQRVGLRIPLTCGTRVTERVKDVNAQGQVITEAVSEDLTVEVLTQCFGMIPFVRQTFDLGTATVGEPTKKERSFTVDLKWVRLEGDNSLPYERTLNGVELTKEATKVFVNHVGLSLRYFPHQSSHLMIGADRYKFSSNEGFFPSDSPLFAPFVRHGAFFETGIRPLWRYGSGWRDFVVSSGVVFGLGRFQARNFAAVGPFNDLDNRKWYIAVGFDPWWEVQ